MERLEARVRRRLHTWNTAKRTALKRKRGHVWEVIPFPSCVIVAALRCVTVTGLDLQEQVGHPSQKSRDGVSAQNIAGEVEPMCQRRRVMR